MRLFRTRDKKPPKEKKDLLAMFISAAIVLITIFLLITGVIASGRLAWRALGL